MCENSTLESDGCADFSRLQSRENSFWSYCSPIINGSLYDADAEDMQYRLSTGEVVDQTCYPKIPHMKSEQARLKTFSFSWPSNSLVTPRDLAQAGFFYLGCDDRVQCFCCGGNLNGWENGDNPWDEHTRHYPNCFFICGHYVGNIPLCIIQGNVKSFEGRLSSFSGVQHPVNPEKLARAGFYSTGQGDKVLCFRCGGGLKDWAPEEDPWIEHAQNYPGCSFLLEEKGREFVNSIQLQRSLGYH